MDMQAVDEVLNQAARCLLLHAVDMMESHSTRDTMICSLRSASATATFLTDWLQLVFDLELCIVDTAYSCYTAWWNKDHRKHKVDRHPSSDPGCSIERLAGTPTGHTTGNKKATKKQKGKK